MSWRTPPRPSGPPSTVKRSAASGRRVASASIRSRTWRPAATRGLQVSLSDPASPPGSGGRAGLQARGFPGDRASGHRDPEPADLSRAHGGAAGRRGRRRAVLLRKASPAVMRVPYSYLDRQFAEPDAILADIRELVRRGDYTLGAA